MKTSFRFLFAAAMVMACCVLLAGCKKEPLSGNDNNPGNGGVTEPNYCVCGNDSLGVRLVVVMRSAYKSDVMDWSFKLSDTQILKFYTTRDLLAGGAYTFVSENDAYNGGNGVYGVYMEGFEETDLQGTIEVRLVDGKTEFVVDATTQDGRSLRLHYWGEPHDLCHPLGNGQCSYGDECLRIDMAYSQMYYDLYEYAFTDSVSSYGATFYTVMPLVSGTYSVSSDMDSVGNGEAINLYLYIEDGSNSLIGDVGDGSATLVVDGSQINITFNGVLDGVQVHGYYHGKLENLGEGIL